MSSKGRVFPPTVPIAILFAAKAFAKQLSQHAIPISTTQYCGLVALNDGNVATSVGSLAKKAGLTPSAMTTAMQEIAEKGLVERMVDDEDRRIIRLQITPKGQELMRDLDPVILQTIANICYGLDNVACRTIFEAAFRTACSVGDVHMRNHRSRVDSAYVFMTLMFKSDLTRISDLHRLHLMESIALCYLEEQDEPVRSCDLAKSMLYHPCSLAKMHPSLIKRGLLRGVTKTGDKRALWLSLTPEGKERAAHVRADFERLLGENPALAQRGKRAIVIEASKMIVRTQQWHL